MQNKPNFSITEKGLVRLPFINSLMIMQAISLREEQGRLQQKGKVY